MKTMRKSGGFPSPKAGLCFDKFVIFKRTADKAVKAGMPVWVRGQLKAWPSTTEFAYLTPDGENGLIMEFINWRVMGFSVSPPPALLKTIGRIEKWTGKRCLAL
jgi:hypothetical protein